MVHPLLVLLLLAGAPKVRDPVEVVNHRLADNHFRLLNPARFRNSVQRANRDLCGRIVDFTHNNGQDNRIYSAILCRKRDLYIYLPPGYDPNLQYPLILWIHGGFGDETAFARSAAIAHLDRLIATGCCPPVVLAAPDATITGEDGILSHHSFFINGVDGRYEDHLLQEVLPFVETNFSISPQREAHAISGYSAGGLPAMAIAIKRREYFATVVTIAGPLNLRYWNCHDRYFEDFSPCTYRWQTDYRPKQKITRYFGGLVHLPAKFFIRPVFGDGHDIMEQVLPNNPADLLVHGDLQPGELNIFLAYAGKDNFNFDAHNESFLWLARQRGIEPTVLVSPDERHSAKYCTWAQTQAYEWLAQRLPWPASQASSPQGESPVPREAGDERSNDHRP